ncbi:MAG: hypothetical protein ACFBRM_02025 [Pikeienuella sp.]
MKSPLPQLPRRPRPRGSGPARSNLGQATELMRAEFARQRISGEIARLRRQLAQSELEMADAARRVVGCCARLLETEEDRE